MNPKRSLYRASLLAAVAFCAVFTRAESWPQWRGPNRDGTTSELSGESGGVWTAVKKWEVALSQGESSPIIVDGRAYYTELGAGNQLQVRCRDAETGSLIWSGLTPGDDFGRYAVGDQNQYKGPEGTPACDGALLFTLSPDGDFYCWDVIAQKTNWGFNLYDEFGMGQRPETGGKGLRDYGYTSSPMLAGSNVLLEVGGSSGVVAAFRKSDGQVVDWWGTGGYAGHSSGPAGPDGKTFVTLTHLWIDGTIKIYVENWYSCALATPAVSENYVVWTADYRWLKTWCFNRSDGSTNWTTTTYETVHSPVIDESNGNAYLAGVGKCLRLSNGSERFSFGGCSSVVVTGDKRLLVFDRYMKCYSATGTKYGQVNNTADRGWPSGAFGEGKALYRSYGWEGDGKLACWSVGTETPGIGVSTTNISVDCEPGSNAASVTFVVRNAGTGTLQYNVSDGGSSRLDVSPTSGNSTGPLSNNVHTVTFTTSGLADGSHYRTITVSDNGSGATNGPITIGVNITVRDGVLDVRVSDNADDAEEKPTGGTVNLTSSDLELARDGTANQTIGIRFRNVTIPQGAAIDSAYVQFKIDEKAQEATDLTIWGEKSANAAVFTTSAGSISGRTKTTASVAGWRPPVWHAVGAAGLRQQTPDVSTLIEEIVGQSGWSSGNALVLIFSGTGRRTAESHNGDAAGAPLLHVTYSAGIVDDDNDGMADSWEITYFGATNAPDGGPDEDKDEDGVTNLGEYRAGTHPDNTNSTFELGITLENGQIVVQQPTIEATGTDYTGYDRYYGLECGPSPTGSWLYIPSCSNVLGDNTTICFTNTDAATTSQFYRANARLE